VNLRRSPAARRAEEPTDGPPVSLPPPAAPADLGDRPPAKEFDYRPALDGLRAVAVIAVIAYHLDRAEGGFLGVDLFFVLSGYLITGLLVAEFQRAGRIAIPEFWARRVRRLYPALLLAVAAVLAYAAFVATPLEQWSLRSDAISSLFYFANWHFIFADQSYFAQFADPSPLRHFWSLAIEEQFYLVWPAALAGLLWLRRGRVGLLVGVIIVGAIASIAVQALLWNAADPSRAYYSTFARAHELLIGALLAVYLQQRGEVRRPRLTIIVTAAAAVAVIVAFAVASDTAGSYYHGGSVLFCLAVAALIAGVEQRGANPIRDALSVAPARYVGRISYSLYLWHWPVILWVTTARVGLSGVALDGLQLVLMFALASASTLFVEEPIRRPGTLRRWLVPRRLALLLPAVSACMVAATFVATRNAESAPGDEYVTVTTPGKRPLTKVPSSVPVAAVFGDSIPRALEPALAAAAERRRWVLVNAAVDGCGIADDVVWANETGDVAYWQDICETVAYPDERQVITQYDPDVVIWYSNTENSEFLVDGAVVQPDTPEHESNLRVAMEAAHDHLTAGGAKLVLVGVAPHSPPLRGCEDAQGVDQCANVEDFNATLPYVNAQLKWLAERHSDTTLISLVDLFCPSGPPCPSEIDGLTVRPDGTHFSDGFAPLIANALLARTASTVPPGG
jgi:peptidoglycan/LPS O-acetylase OafA/YrhL